MRFETRAVLLVLKCVYPSGICHFQLFGIKRFLKTFRRKEIFFECLEGCRYVRIIFGQNHFALSSVSDPFKSIKPEIIFKLQAKSCPKSQLDNVMKSS